MKDRVVCPRRDADGRGGLPGHDRSIPRASETSKSGRRDVKGCVHPSRRQEAKRQERRAPAGLPDGQTVRPDSHTPRRQRPFPSPRPVHTRSPDFSPPPKNSFSSPFSLPCLSVRYNLRQNDDSPFSSSKRHHPPRSPLHDSLDVSSFRGSSANDSLVSCPRFPETPRP